jgi:putative transposase
VGIAIAGANAHDVKLLRATLQSMPVPRPKSTGRCRTSRLIKDTVPAHGISRGVSAISAPRKGEVQAKRRPGQRAHRWVVEGSHSWTNRARRLLVRWEKKLSNYLAFIHLQFAYIALKQARVLG